MKMLCPKRLREPVIGVVIFNLLIMSATSAFAASPSDTCGAASCSSAAAPEPHHPVHSRSTATSKALASKSKIQPCENDQGGAPRPPTPPQRVAPCNAP